MECRLGQKLLCVSSSELLTVVRHFDGGAAFIVDRWSVNAFFEKAVEITVLFCNVELANRGAMVDENISLGLDIGDCSAVMGHNFIEQIGIWCAVEASNDLPFNWAVSV